MIVDDRKLIIGSANINDRSMLGSRDSELGLLVDAGSDGVVADMRRQLMAEHLGALGNSSSLGWDPNLLDDPVSDAFFNGVWRKTALDNMNIFDEVHYTSDYAHCFLWRLCYQLSLHHYVLLYSFSVEVEVKHECFTAESPEHSSPLIFIHGTPN